MKRITWGELRYAVLLLILLVMALYASFESVSFVEDLIIDDYLNRAGEKLAEIITAEESQLRRLVREVSSRISPEEGPAQYVNSLLLTAGKAGVPLVASAVVGGQRVLAWAAQGVSSSEVYQVLVSSICSNAGGWVQSSQPAYTRLQGHIAALATWAVEGGTNHCVTALLVTSEELRAIRKRYPEFVGILPASQTPPASAISRMLRDPAGRKVGQLVMRVDQGRVSALADSIAVAIRSLTMGFILLAGALGIWAVRSTVCAETRRKLGRFVEEMGYFKDGVVALTRRGTVLGVNPAMRVMLGRDVRPGRARLRDIFPELSDQDLDFLFALRRPREIEKIHLFGGVVRVWRFRSQPADDIDLLLVSDVTERRERERIERQVAVLQLIGRVARGVAHDFNDILGVITGNAELIRMHAKEQEVARAASSIRDQAMQGAEIAARLLDLTRAGEPPPCGALAESIRKAAEFLELTTGTRCTVVAGEPGHLPPVVVGCLQVQHIVISLGMLAHQQSADKSALFIAVTADVEGLPAGREVRLAVGPVDPRGMDEVKPERPAVLTATDAGAVVATVQSILSEVGGKVEFTSSGGHTIYYVRLPVYQPTEEPTRIEGVLQYLERWRILLALKDEELMTRISQEIAAAKAQCDRAGDIVGTLSLVNSEKVFDGIIADVEMLGDDPPGMLRAVAKLQRRAGIVLVARGDEQVTLPDIAGIRTVSAEARPTEILLTLLEAASSRRG